MAKWIKTKRACATLWTTLYKMHQFKTSFSTSGDLRMADLTFYNKLSSSEMRDLEVQVIADQIDKIFIKGRGAKYEEGIDSTIALTAMIKILRDETKLVKDLAEVADLAYHFSDE